MATATVDGITVGVMFRDLGKGAVFAGYLPDWDGIEFSIVAKPGREADVTDYDGNVHRGVITHASPADCNIWVQVTSRGELT